MLTPISKADIPPIRVSKYGDEREEVKRFIESGHEAAEIAYDAEKYHSLDEWRSVYRTVASQFPGIATIQRKERLFILKNY